MEAGERYVEEVAAFAGFANAAQRYICRSLDIIDGDQQAIARWPRTDWEFGSVLAQQGLYKMLQGVALPRSAAFWELADFIRYALPPAAFDVAHGGIDGFPAFLFLYERLLGGASRPWLPMLFSAACTSPNILPKFGLPLLRSVFPYLTETDWPTDDPVFRPSWIADPRP